MSNSWRSRYEALGAFVDAQPLVEIEENIVSIDETVRDEFYRKFNDVRRAFLAQHYSGWLDEAQFLSARYGKIEAQLRQLLQLKAVMMPVALQRFLSDPMHQAVRDLFDPLFELLQGKIEIEQFEEEAQERVQASFRDFYQRGYVKWFILNLVEYVDPEKIFEVPLPKPTSKQLIKHRDDVRTNVPFPRETDTLQFEVDRKDILLAPDFIVRSKRLERYVAFRTEMGKALWRASYHSEKRQWFVISALLEKYGYAQLKPDLLLYIGDKLEDVSLVADCEKLCRPDVAVFFLDQLDSEEERVVRKMESIRLAHDILNPLKGTFIFARDHLPESVDNRLDENMHVIQFGFDKMKWDLLMNFFETEPVHA